MPLQFQDYYAVLEVSRSASLDEIRRAFRRLARQYHPDLSNAPEAESKFKEINEAYEVLGDPDKRSRYDRLGASWTGPADRQSPGTGFGFEMGGAGFSEFFDTHFGAGSRRQSNAGAAESDLIEADLLISLREVALGAVRPITVHFEDHCRKCNGSGRTFRGTCGNCLGNGRFTRRETQRVRIPPGIEDGRRLRVPRPATAPGRGNDKGDILLTVHYEKHPAFEVEGRDLLFELELAPWQAVLGTTISVPCLTGPVMVRIPPGTQPATRLRLRSHGLPDGHGRNGDLLVSVRVLIPANIDSGERALWQKLARYSASGNSLG